MTEEGSEPKRTWCQKEAVDRESLRLFSCFLSSCLYSSCPMIFNCALGKDPSTEPRGKYDADLVQHKENKWEPEGVVPAFILSSQPPDCRGVENREESEQLEYKTAGPTIPPVISAVPLVAVNLPMCFQQ